MQRVARAVLFELLRLASWRRWLLPALMVLAAVFVASRQVAESAHVIGGTPSGWDVHAALSSSRGLLSFVIVVGFVLLIGNVVGGDRQSRLSWLVVPRVGGRTSWWITKLITVLVAAVMLQLLVLALCLGVGAALEAWSISPAASSYATAAATMQPANAEVQLPILFPDGYALGGLGRHFVIAAYQALAFTSLASLLLALSVCYWLSVLPVLVALVGLVADSFLSQKVSGWWVLSPGSRLLEGNHTYLAGSRAYDWAGSLAFWLAMLTSAAVTGFVLLRRTDL